MKKFCLLTSGRAGSTALMDRIALLPEVAVPGKDIDCRDQELTHPKQRRRIAAAYAELTGRPINTIPELVDGFYRYHAGAAFAGFKTMVNRHPDIADFVRREDIQFIVLRRKDIAATVASFMLAMEQGTWRRDGGQPRTTWTFSAENAGRVASNLEYVMSSNRVLGSVPNAILLDYESLCRTDFGEERLDAFFGHRIRLSAPKPPTDASSYVSNWDAFTAFLRERLEQRRRNA
jgi:hypothetical protein